MQQVNIPPTRAILLETRRDLALAREGADLLDRKRQALVAYARETLADTEDVEERLDERFAAAYGALSRAAMAMGAEGVEWVALSVKEEPIVDIRERSLMGLRVPIVQASPRPLHLRYSLSDTTASVDRAGQAFGELLALVAQAAELETTAYRLAREIRRTQRRVNALKNVLIPRYEAIVSRVEGVLEEKEREDLYRAKAVKRLQEHSEQGDVGPSRDKEAV